MSRLQSQVRNYNRLMEWVPRALLMTDVERSTRLWQEDAGAMARAIARHDAIVEQVIGAHDGRLIKTRGEGDSTFSVFLSAADAARAAVALQTAIENEPWPLSRPLRIRSALNFGNIEDRSGDCYGPEVNLCARLRAAAGAGQVLASGAVARMLGDVAQDFEIAPLGRHRLKDLAEIVEVHQLAAAGRQETFEPIASLNATAGVLPEFGSPFMGRETELTELARLLRGRRLVTIVGPGGVGKSRLAAEAARRFTDWTPDGAHFIDLGSVRGGDHLPGVIGPALKLRAEATVGVDSLVAELASREACLVLDRCEHLNAEIVPLLKRVTQGCPHLTVLATSRSTLKISGEQTFRLMPLETPESGADAEQIAQAPAVRFFVSRATMARHDFTVTPKNARAIVSICSRLDGIPAALEMAALRVRSLSPEQLEARLSNRFRVLGTAGAQDSLQALFDWSWDSLTEHEQRFAWCATRFEGSFDLEAAEAIAEGFEALTPTESGDGLSAACLDPYAAIDYIDSLVEKSLIHADEQDSAMRYRLSSTFREYAMEKWTDPAARRSLERAHAEYFHRLIDDVPPDAAGSDAKNLSRALEFFLAAERPEPAAEMALFLTEHWQAVGAYAEGSRTVKRALQALGPKRAALSARLLNAIGSFEYNLGRYELARGHLNEAIAMADEDAVRAKALNNLALTDMAGGDNDAALASLEAALPFDRAAGNDKELSRTLSNLGYLLILNGELPRAKEVLEEALLVTGRSGDKRAAIPCLCNLSDLALEQHDLELSAEYAERGLEYSDEVNYKVGAACCVTNLAEVQLGLGNLSEAERLLRRALGQCIDMGATWLLGSILDLLGIAFWRNGDVEPAKTAFVYRRVAVTLPSPPRFAAEAGDIFALVESQVGAEALARSRHDAEIGGMASLLDDLPHIAPV